MERHLVFDLLQKAVLESGKVVRNCRLSASDSRTFLFHPIFGHVIQTALERWATAEIHAAEALVVAVAADPASVGAAVQSYLGALPLPIQEKHDLSGRIWSAVKTGIALRIASVTGMSAPDAEALVCAWVPSAPMLYRS